MDSFDLNSAIESIKSLGFKVIRPLTAYSNPNRAAIPI